MGGEDVSQRASSPLKRRASDLEIDAPSSQQEDVDMITAPPSQPRERVIDSSVESARQREESVDMLKGEGSDDTSPSLLPEEGEKKVLTQIPDIDYQISTVTTLIKASAEGIPSEGDKTWLVSRKWLKRVTDRGSLARQTSKEEPVGEIGPLDNSDIVKQIIKLHSGEDFVLLKDGLGIESFELFPEDAFCMVAEWYGLMPGTLPIVRYAHNTNSDPAGLPNMVFEFHPPVFVIHRLWSELSNNLDGTTKKDDPDAPVFVVSRSARYHNFLREMKLAAGISLKKPVRVWSVKRSLPAAEQVAPAAAGVTPPSSRPGSPAAATVVTQTPQVQDSWKKLLLDVTEFVKLERNVEREVVDFKDSTTSDSYNGNRTLDLLGLGSDQALILEEEVSPKNWVSTYTSGGKSGKNGNTSLIPSQNNSGRNSPAPTGYNLRSNNRSYKNGRTAGTVGLSNLGNTCYMNSALQCVRSVEELTKYFLFNIYTEELNFDNVLGNNGAVAQAYANLLKEIYKEPPPTSVTPRSFKNTVGKYAPSFSGYGQQDSQEFIGFLLDGLQEDLSRIKKKPYIEKPDSTDEMISNPEAIRDMAARVWDITKQRDDSIIADLFTGMYRSTLVCPVCDKVSITFDPFDNLTLQLPIESTWSHVITFLPLNDRPVKLEVELDKHATIRALKQYINKKFAIPVERLMVADVFKCKFYKFYDDFETCSEVIQTSDDVFAYDVEAKPTNWPAPADEKKKTKSLVAFGPSNNDGDDLPSWDSPMSNKLLVPVVYRRANENSMKASYSFEGIPHFIVLDPAEACSEDIIKRKILEKVATFTTSIDMARAAYPSSVSDSVDTDIVLTTGSDADSSGDGKVFANSLDGEDEIVDVTMKEARTTQAQPNSTLATFNTRRPEFLNPEEYIVPELQNLFELCYFGGKETLPTGWNQTDENRVWPRIADRVPRQPDPVEDTSYDEYDVNGRAGSTTSGKSSGASSVEEASNDQSSAQTRMNDESSEDELNAQPSQSLPHRPAAQRIGGPRFGNKKRRGKPKHIKTYSKKEQRAMKKQQRQQKHEELDEEVDTNDGGPLIRIGEGIVVDWNEAAFDSLFGNSGHGGLRGFPAWANISKIEDPELRAKRGARAARKRNGITLSDCLDEFGKEEILSEMDTWYCPRCKEHRRASKKFELWKTPDILIMHLKRFSSSGYRRDKLDVMVDFPVEGLDLSSRVMETQDGKEEIYDLIAVDDHWGGLGGGHYTAFAKNFVDGQWYEYNDSSVSKCNDSSRVVTAAAYLLFYRRRSSSSLGGEVLQAKLDAFETFPSDDSDSGEDGRLVGNSSPRGSSSALRGAGAAVRQQNHGLADGEEMKTINPADIEDELPAYRLHQGEEDSAPLLLHDAEMNDGVGLRESIEDEGVDMSMGLNIGLPSYQADWDWSAINTNNRNQVSGTGSDADADADGDIDLDNRSDIVNDNSSASSGSRRGRIEDFDNAPAVDDDGSEFVDQSLPVPEYEGADMNYQMIGEKMESGAWGSGGGDLWRFNTAMGDGVDDEPAAEIHLDSEIEEFDDKKHGA